MKFIIGIYLIIVTLLVITKAAKNNSKLQEEKVLEPLEVVVSKAENKTETKAQEKAEEKPYVSDVISITNYKNGTFANVSDCLYFYQRGGTATVKILSKNGTESVQHLTFEHVPFKYRGNCFQNSTRQHSFISLRFKLLNDSQNAGNLKINGTFIKNKNGNWELENMYAKLYNLDKEFKIDCKNLETPIKFSYSCKKFSVESFNNLTKETLILKLNNLQIQPFYNGEVFADSFDCSTLFTLGSWMGVIVLWIFTMVVGIGAFSLINIKTMDRFDNTKGKLTNNPIT